MAGARGGVPRSPLPAPSPPPAAGSGARQPAAPRAGRRAPDAGGADRPAPSPPAAPRPTGRATGTGPRPRLRARRCSARLTLAQRVGQLFLVGVDGDIAGPQLTAAERTYHFGSLLLNESAAGTAALAGQTAAHAVARAVGHRRRRVLHRRQPGGRRRSSSSPGPGSPPCRPRSCRAAGRTARCARRRRGWGTEPARRRREPRPRAGDGRGAGRRRRRPTRRSARLTGSSAPTRRSTARTAPPSSRGWPRPGSRPWPSTSPGSAG